MIDQIAPNNEFAFVLFLVILLLIGVLRQWERNRLTLFLRSFVNPNLVDTQLRQERAFSRLALFSFVLVLLVISTFFALLLHFYGLFLDFSFSGLLFSLLIAILLVTTARVAIYAFLAWLFSLERLQQFHMFHWLLTNTIQAALLLPLSVLLVFAPAWVHPHAATVGITVICVFYLIRVIRLSILSSVDFRVPLGYNLLYICALEIFPVIVVITVISRQIVG